MRLVIDTNVLVSAAYRPDSRAGRLVLAAFGPEVDLHAPEHVREELRRILGGKLGFDIEGIEAALLLLPVAWVPAAVLEDFMDEARSAISDPDDAPVVAAAMLLACPAVSGDRAFHPLRRPLIQTLRLADVDL